MQSSEAPADFVTAIHEENILESENVGFIDNTGGEQLDMGHNENDIAMVDGTPDVTLGQFLSRPTLIKNISWAMSDVPSVLSSFKPWYEFFNNTKIKKKIDNYASKYKDYPNPKNALMRGVLLGAEFSYHLRDSEVERLRKELNNALSVKVNEQAIKQIVNRPGIVSKICANEIRKNETLESELATLKKQVEEMEVYKKIVS